MLNCIINKVSMYSAGAYAAFSAGGCTLSLSGPHVRSP